MGRIKVSQLAFATEKLLRLTETILILVVLLFVEPKLSVAEHC